MDRDHAIRIAVSRLKGSNRATMIDYLCKHPHLISKAQVAHLPFYTKKEKRPSATVELEPWSKP